MIVEFAENRSAEYLPGNSLRMQHAVSKFGADAKLEGKTGMSASHYPQMPPQLRHVRWKVLRNRTRSGNTNGALTESQAELRHVRWKVLCNRNRSSPASEGATEIQAELRHVRRKVLRNRNRSSLTNGAVTEM